MMSLRMRFARIGALLVGLALVWACNAPPIVVPPPAVAFSSELLTDSTGAQRTFWRATQPTPLTLTANATFRLYNLDRDFGYIVRASSDGTFVSQPMDGVMDDRILLYYITPAGDYSDSICLLLREAAPVAPFCP
jgi:hypothetical protein